MDGAVNVTEVVPVKLAELIAVVAPVEQDELDGDTVATDDAVELAELVLVEVVLGLTVVVSVGGPVEPAELVPVEVALVLTVVVPVDVPVELAELLPVELAELVAVVVPVELAELVGDTVATDDAVELV